MSMWHIYSSTLAIMFSIIQFPVICSLKKRYINSDDKEPVYRSYQTSTYCKPSMKIQYPKNISEVLQLVQEGVAKSENLKAIGNLYSINDIICTDGIPISLTNLNQSKLNQDGTASFGAGIELIHALKFLQEQNKTFIHVPTFGGITLGGAIGTGSHGSSLIHPTSLSDQLVRLKIIDGMGVLREITEAEDINAFRVHLGLLGIIVEVTLSIVPLFKMKVSNTLESESILMDGTALKWAESHDWFQMWWFSSTSNVVVSKGSYLSNNDFISGNSTTDFIPNLSPIVISGVHEAYETLQATKNAQGMYAIQNFTELSLYTDVIGRPPLYSEDKTVLKNPAVGIGWQLMNNKCENLCPWNNGKNASIMPEESSVGIPLHKLADAVKTIKEILNSTLATFSMIGIFIRFSKSSPSIMGISSGRQTVTLEFATPMRENPYEDSKYGIAAYQAILQSLVNNYEGRAHWGKNGLYYFTQKVVQKSFKKLDTFKAYANKYDPNKIFMNKFGRRILMAKEDMDKDPKVQRCALQDYCVCNKTEDCAQSQTCGKVNEFSVCKEIDLKDLLMDFKDYVFTNWTSIFNTISIIQHLNNK